MSSKINIVEIVKGHFGTLVNAQGKLSLVDAMTFVGLPIAIAVLGAFLSFDLSDQMASLLVNFGSIFTALLLSVLVLVYDQESKVDSRAQEAEARSKGKEPTSSNGPVFNAALLQKKALLRQLYYNISYSVLCSIALVVFCFVHSIVNGSDVGFSISGHVFSISLGSHVITPLIVFVAVNLLMNILMIVKRMHALLVTQ